MATSPNFSWPEPDNTDLVKNGALAIRTAVDAIDASMVDLKGGTTGQVLKKNTNTDMDFVWSADSAGMTNPMTTTGDTIYSSSGSTPARLGIGSSGQVLTVASGVPSWATPAGGGGAVLQVKNSKATTYQQITSTSYVDLTNLSVAITPSSSSNKVLVFVNVNGVSGGGGSNKGRIALTDGSGTVLAVLNDYTTPTTTMAGYSLSYLDSPGSTSAKTYKLMGLTDSGASFYINNFASVTIVSTITVMEVTP